MQYVLYFLIAIGATTVGSLTGMGGGVIIKPLMDVLHGFDVQTIGVLSSLTVFSMSVVSIGKQMLARTKIPFGTAIPLALGSVAGGLAGEKLLQVIVDALRANSAVTVVQNVVLSLLILAVFLYMKNKSRIPSRELRGVVVSSWASAPPSWASAAGPSTWPSSSTCSPLTPRRPRCAPW